MKTLRRAACVVVLLGIVAAARAEGPSTVRAGPPSVEDFFRKSQYGGAVLSPSGRYLAVIAPVGEHRGLGVIDLETRAPPQTMTAGAGDDVVGILWQTDERLIVFLGDLQRVAGEWPHQSGIAAINRDGTYARKLDGSVLTRIPGTNEVLLTARDRTYRSLDLYRYDTVTRAKTLLSFDSPGYVSQWVADRNGVPRAAVTDDLNNDTSAWYIRRSGSDAWTKVEEAKLGRLTSFPLQFDPDGKLLYVAARREGSDREAIYEYNVDTERWSKAIAQHPERDIGADTAQFVVDYRTHKLLGLRYIDDRPAAVWFDNEWARIQKAVDAALPDTVNVISQPTGAAKRWMIVASSDRNPGEVYLLDSGTMRMEKLFSYRPWIDPNAMAPTKWVRYSARDGLSIPALLTLPRGASDKPVPLIVDIHGGPNVEADQWRYDREVQFFASRGYAVLQPQFRGTQGFGWKLESSGYRKWGDEMQDDLEDGVKWAVAKGIADPSRVCFYGGSYGGYAAAWGAIKNAGLIKCAVAVVAVTSIDYLFDNAQTDLSLLADRSSLMAEQIGDPKTERARFKRVNPLDNADKVGVPILLAYGGSDVRVPLVHGTDFRSALEKYHKDYEWLEYGGEGHGFNRDEDVFDFYHRVEQFLAKYLHGDTPAVRSVAAPEK